ncbi:TfoX/Sxy family DNA transformation protein [Bdellovibrio sp. KM01]|uniref:TfoX/Sxy family DNA transformation protein n=1 Tax=Bdellovibrio sp. KM01 TaxID=2748865 RepID=UPI0015EA2828|nr:TfoX/Sxy family DNA transformation protein [Bdellovibrio sp. KM01]QLY23897.1 TfoX/Sxy family DNA transformation protein [Bdellovibrio sp. KM01]
MAKEPLELKWIENLLPEEGYRRKSMFGGFAYYLDEKIILITFEAGHKSNWNGCMFPVEREFQGKVLEKFPILNPHPILPKWLYLPIETEGFDEWVSDILRVALRPNSIWGSIPKEKNKSAPGKTKGRKANVANEVITEKIDTRRPRMFSDDDPVAVLQKAKKLTDLKNIGPVLEELLHDAGIKTPQQMQKLGWQKTMVKLVKAHPKTNHSMYAYTIITALENKDFGGMSEQQKSEVRAYMKTLRDRLKS